MMYSMSQIDLKKFESVAGSLRAEFGGSALLDGTSGLVSGSNVLEGNAAIGPCLNYPTAMEMRDTAKAGMGEGGRKAGAEVFAKGQDVVVRLPANEVLFQAGSAQLTPLMNEVLHGLLRSIRRYGCTVKVEGHTCNMPIHSAAYSSNWELSADRARNVTLYLLRHSGQAPEGFSFMAFAHTRPLVPNTSETNRRRNRRVEIIFHPTKSAKGMKLSAPATLTTPTEAKFTGKGLDAAPIAPSLLPPLPDLAAEFARQKSGVAVSEPSREVQ